MEIEDCQVGQEVWWNGLVRYSCTPRAEQVLPGISKILIIDVKDSFRPLYIHGPKDSHERDWWVTLTDIRPVCEEDREAEKAEAESEEKE